jgi:allantoicase
LELNEGLDRFNALSRDEAERRLYSCFANHGWAARVAQKRPYADLNALLASAESAWAGLSPGDWLDAFAAHPRIGERGGHSPAASEREQEHVRQGSPETLAALASDNRLYEERFGHVFLIAASGRAAAEILEVLRQRMTNDPDVELDVATGEYRKITRLRLEEMLRA